MLRELNIKNFALIDCLNIQFDSGLNVLTGETGAGKSIIIDAVNLALGGRASKDYIKKGRNHCIVEVVFDIKNNYNVQKVLNNFGLNYDADKILIISRELNVNNKNICRVNGRPVTLGILKNISSYLIDIHGQHEHQFLLNIDNHIHILDNLSGKQSEYMRKQVAINYNKWKKIKDSIKQLLEDDSEREKKIDFLTYQIQEIDSANLKPKEEKELLQKYKIIKNSQILIQNLGKAYSNLYSGELNGVCAIDILSNSINDIQKILKIDKNIDYIYENLNNILLQMQDTAIEIRQYMDNLEFDAEKLNEIEQRIDVINRLKRKYGSSITSILEYRQKISKELELYKHAEKQLEKLKTELKLATEKLYKSCMDISVIRRQTAKKLEKLVNKELDELGLENARFVVDIQSPNANKKFEDIIFKQYGFDTVEFMISTNVGQDLKPLSKVVSGGEASRIMLALKKILASVDDISCMIFDEIDTGISGKTGQMVAEKIAQISSDRQVICVTHLASIAAMADVHLLIEKKVKNGDTIVSVKKLNDNQTVLEIARLLSGKDITDLSLNHAREMLKTAKKLKNVI